MTKDTAEKLSAKYIQLYKNTKSIQHNYSHIKRVLNHAQSIGIMYGHDIDLSLLKLITILHDLTYIYHKYSNYTYFGERIIIKRILKSILSLENLSQKDSQIIINACSKHSFSIPYRVLNKKEDIYTQILQDADSIDYLNEKRIKSYIEESNTPKSLAEYYINIIRKNYFKYLNLDISKQYYRNLINKDFKPYTIFNANKKSTVVVLHGYADKPGMFDSYIKIHQNKRIIAVNFPMNMEFNFQSYSIPELADYVLDIVNKLNTKEFSLVGFSLGGLVATELTKKAPERIQSIQLLSSYPYLLPNKVLRPLYRLTHKILLTPFSLKIISILNTNPLLRKVLHLPHLNKDALRRMRSNYLSIFGTVLRALNYDGRNIYTKYQGEKGIFFFRDDPILKFKTFSKQAFHDKIQFREIISGGHCESDDYFQTISSFV